MQDNGTKALNSVCALLDDWSMEITAKDGPRLEQAAGLIAKGTRIPIAFLQGETIEARVATAKKVKGLGFVPIPHISARRLHSQQELEAFLHGLQHEIGTDRVFVVAGDLPEPAGPYHDALSVMRTGLLEQYGIRRVGIAGYPEGHSGIGDAQIWKAKQEKLKELVSRGHGFAIATQFGFDSEPMVKWVEQVREAGIHSLIRLGVPGPASVKRLLSFATRCGVGASASVMKKYGVSITKLLTTAGPDRLIEELAAGLDPAKHGKVMLHFYPFGGIKETVEWVREFQAKNGCTITA